MGPPRQAPALGFTPTPEGFRREDLTEARIAEIGRLIAAESGWQIASEAEREASRRALVEDAAPGEDVWIFGFGSLMWNPALDFTEMVAGRVHGYHRRYCLWTTFGRASPERPGMVLAMMPGGSCLGMAIRIPWDRAVAETRLLWRREMISGGYLARRVPVRIAGGETVQAIAFLANPDHPRYAGRVDEASQIEHIAFAEGRLGCGRDYLHNMKRTLDGLGVRDGPVHRLHRGVVARRAVDGLS